MFQVKQITAAKLLLNLNWLEDYLKAEYSDIISENSWMNEWEQLAKRFQFLKFKEISETEINSLEWD